tara:strand:+ start:4005 stop:4136 length:132 start_codon:yes stop_codon:yes gene_type:complete
VNIPFVGLGYIKATFAVVSNIPKVDTFSQADVSTQAPNITSNA